MDQGFGLACIDMDSADLVSYRTGRLRFRQLPAGGDSEVDAWYNADGSWQTSPQPFAKYAACSATNAGSFADVVDSTVNTYGATITTGGGTYHIHAYCNGKEWTVEGGGTSSAVGSVQISASGTVRLIIRRRGW